MAEIAAFDTSMLVFVDETGCDKRNALRKFGYALRGHRASAHTFLSRGRRISAVGAMCSSDCNTVEGTVDADTFYDFTQRLLKLLMPFNGINPNSVVVLDSCTILPELPELIRSVGELVKFLPPYSPDLMSIELAFGKVKGYIKEKEAAYQAIPNFSS